MPRYPETSYATETKTGEPHRDAAVAYAAAERLVIEQMRLQSIKAPIAGNQELPAVVTRDGSINVVTALLAAPLTPPVVRVQAPESLIAYVDRFGGDQTVLFVEDVPQPRLTAVLDFHTAADDAAAGYQWGRHRVVYEPLLTPEWNTWTGISGKRLDQVTFAQFLEDNLPDIATPPGADILEVARTLELKKAVNFLSSVRLDNGQVQLRYEEQIEGSAQKGLLQIPDVIVLGLQPFKGADRYEVRGRFRYRLEGTSVKLGIDLDRIHKVLEAAVRDTLTTVIGELEVPVFYGPAPAVASDAPITLR